MIHRVWSSIGSKTLLQVTASGTAQSTIEKESKATISAAIAEIGQMGAKPEHIVRSRIWARNSTVRRIASDVRRTMLLGSMRAASSSYSDAERLHDGCNMAIDLTVLCSVSRGAKKTVVEYAPVIAPPMYVTLDGMLFLSGNTDGSPNYQGQIATIRNKIGDVLSGAGSNWQRLALITVFVSKQLDPHVARSAIAAHFSGAPCPLVVSAVDGFSSPEKLVEVEVTASLA
jgi:enamine deaminase RidA (YjgF/YER057c/UK114 family)